MTTSPQSIPVHDSTTNRLVRRIVPEAYLQGDTDRVRRVHLAVVIGIAILLLCLSYIAIFWTLANIPASITMFVAFISFLLLLHYFRRTGNLQVFVHGIAGITLVVHTVNCLSVGGVETPFVLGYLILPLLATLLLGRQAGLVWTVIGMVMIVVLGWLSYAGLAPNAPYPPELAPLARTVLAILVYFPVMLFVMLLQLGLEQTLLALDRKNIEVSDALQRSDELLLNVLPSPIADRLKGGEHNLADHFAEVTVLFADIVDFTQYSEGLSAAVVVSRLNTIFGELDTLATKHGIEKIKTIGDCYMAVGGIPYPCDDHLERVVAMALDIQLLMDQLDIDGSRPLQMRIGIHTGEAVAGVIGHAKYIYDLWGDTVNTASRMESNGAPGRIQCTEEVYRRLGAEFEFEQRGAINIKGKGLMRAYFLVGRRVNDQEIVTGK